MNEAELWHAINCLIRDVVQLQQAVKELTQKINERNN